MDQYQFILNKINITSIMTNSGLFIGRNYPSNWHVQTKVNNGFGSGEGIMLGNTNIVIDNDVLDTPVDDRDILLSSQGQQPNADTESQLTMIHFKEVHVNTLERNSTIAIGENEQLNWTSNNKSNYGNGMLAGENTVGRNLHIIQDNDAVDAPVSIAGNFSTIENETSYSREDS